MCFTCSTASSLRDKTIDRESSHGSRVNIEHNQNWLCQASKVLYTTNLVQRNLCHAILEPFFFLLLLLFKRFEIKVSDFKTKD